MEVAQSVRTPSHERRVEINEEGARTTHLKPCQKGIDTSELRFPGGVKGAEEGIKPFMDPVLRSRKKVCVRKTQR